MKFEKVFKTVDNSESGEFVEFLTDDARFRFANLPVVQGRENIKAFLDEFFKSIDHTGHSDLREWQSGETWFVTGQVTYFRHDGSSLKVPFCNQFNMKGDKIDDYLIFVDNSQLYR